MTLRETLNDGSHGSRDIDTSPLSTLHTYCQQTKFIIVGCKASQFCVRLIFHLSEHTAKKEHCKPALKQYYEDLILPKQCWSARVQIVLSKTPIICVNQIQSSTPYSSISICMSYVSKNLTDVAKSKTETWKYKARSEGVNDGKKKTLTELIWKPNAVSNMSAKIWYCHSCREFSTKTYQPS